MQDVMEFVYTGKATTGYINECIKRLKEIPTVDLVQYNWYDSNDKNKDVTIAILKFLSEIEDILLTNYY